MSLVRDAAIRLVNLFRRERLERELDAELRAYLDLDIGGSLRRGLAPKEARRTALARLGGLEFVKEQCRDVHRFRAADELERMMVNLRLALRMLLKTPLVTSVAIASLALGIGVNAAVFSLYSQFLLRPLPVVEPEGLVNLESPGPKPGSCRRDNAGGCDHVFSYPMFRDLERGQTVFSTLAAHKGIVANVAYGGRVVTVQGSQVSGSYFPALGLLPATGRLFGSEIDEPVGGHPVVVLSHDFWQSELDGSPDAVGDVLVVNGQPLTIVGVTQAGFRGTTFNMPCDFFVPITMHGLLTPDGDGRFEDRDSYWTYLFARLEPGVSIDRAQAALEPMYRNILAEAEAPLLTGMTAQAKARFLDRPLHLNAGWQGQSAMHDSRSRAGQRVALVFLFGIATIVLLIACANVVNLLLTQSASRAGEIAMRLALGASRRHVLAQLLTESCLLAVLAGAAGLVAAHWTLRLVVTLVPPLVADLFRTTLDPYVLPFTAAVSLATSVLFGIFPALHATRGDPLTEIRHGAVQSPGAPAATRFRHGLVVAQIALATTLLAMAGLFVRSLHNVNLVDLGFRTEHVTAFHVWPELNGQGPVRSRAVYERIGDDLSAQPGVRAVTAASRLLLDGEPGMPVELTVQGFEADPDTDRTTRLERIGTEYFGTLGIPLLAGRTFSEADTLARPKVAIVNQSFARKFDLGRNAVGRRIGRGGLDAELDIEIVGLVGDIRRSVTSPLSPPVAYVPYRQEEQIGGLWFYVWSSLPSDAVVRSIPTVVAGVDPNLPAGFVMPLARMAELNKSEYRAAAILLVCFAALATLLAAVGLFGVLAYAVAQRTREFGLRMALGADATRLRVSVLGQVGRMTLTGGALGLVAALGLGRAAQSALYEIEGVPLAIVAAVVLGLAAVAMAAGFVPAHRASRIDPMAALRHK